MIIRLLMTISACLALYGCNNNDAVNDQAAISSDSMIASSESKVASTASSENSQVHIFDGAQKNIDKDKKYQNPNFRYVERATEISPENQFIKSHMYDSYAEYDANNGCWNLDKEKDSYYYYCMEVKRIHNLVIDNKEYKFIEINGLIINKENGRIDSKGGAHASPGISGLYVFTKDNKKWNLVSKIPEFHSSSWGKSGVDESSFTKFGPDVYGWKISSEYVGFGELYESVSYIALVNNHLTKILEFPLTFNADGTENEERIKENFKNKIVINHNKTINGLFLIELNYSSIETKKTYSIIFDVVKNMYLYPTDLPNFIQQDL